LCASPSCSDGVKNGLESDVDCGTGCPKKCGVNLGCTSGSDCESDYCANGVCTTPNCFDGVKNGLETDVDCGGPCETKCILGASCQYGADCESGVCEYNVCSVDKNLDSDGDGMPDWWEDKYNLQKLDPSDADKDQDKDGYTNLEEYENQTDPNSPDEGGKNHTINIILLVIGLLLMIGSGGFLYYYRNYLLPESKPSQQRQTAQYAYPSQPGWSNKSVVGVPPSQVKVVPKQVQSSQQGKSDLLRQLLLKRKGAQPSAKSSVVKQESKTSDKPLSQIVENADSQKKQVLKQEKVAPSDSDFKEPVKEDVFAKLKNLAEKKDDSKKSTKK
jgi:hypothetical protein